MFHLHKAVIGSGRRKTVKNSLLHPLQLILSGDEDKFYIEEYSTAID